MHWITFFSQFMVYAFQTEPPNPSPMFSPPYWFKYGEGFVPCLQILYCTILLLYTLIVYNFRTLD